MSHLIVVLFVYILSSASYLPLSGIFFGSIYVFSLLPFLFMSSKKFLLNTCLSRGETIFFSKRSIFCRSGLILRRSYLSCALSRLVSNSNISSRALARLMVVSAGVSIIALTSSFDFFLAFSDTLWSLKGLLVGFASTLGCLVFRRSSFFMYLMIGSSVSDMLGNFCFEFFWLFMGLY